MFLKRIERNLRLTAVPQLPVEDPVEALLLTTHKVENDHVVDFLLVVVLVGCETALLHGYSVFADPTHRGIDVSGVRFRMSANRGDRLDVVAAKFWMILTRRVTNGGGVFRAESAR